MNSTGWGGRRVGAGQKPTKPKFAPTVHSGGKEPAESSLSAVPPEDLPAGQREFWHKYAGFAIEKRTLIPHTEANFRLLCQQAWVMDLMLDKLIRDDWTQVKVTIDGSGQEHREQKAHALLSAYQKCVKQVDSLEARYGLAAFGKAELPMAKKTAVNQWAAVAQK